MTMLLALCLLAQTQDDSLKRFHENYAKIHVSSKFTYSVTTISRDEVMNGKLWTSVDHEATAKRTVTGRWDCDGEAEHTICSSTLTRKPTRPGDIVPGRSAMEVLTNGSVTAYHELDGSTGALQARTGNEDGLLDHGPFYFFFERFPNNLTRIFGNEITPIHRQSMRDGKLCDVEIYHAGSEDSDFWIEIAYHNCPAISRTDSTG